MQLDITPDTNLVFFTGAGLSAESGVPTYRGQGGLWHEYRYEDYACQQAFEHNPQKVWDFHNKRRVATQSCLPHKGHHILAKVVQQYPTTIITQNIDGMLQRAGISDVIELHGSLWELRHPTSQEVTPNLEAPLTKLKTPDGYYWRPNIIWFGDSLNPKPFKEAEQALSQADLVILIGTSGVVYPAAGLPLIASQKNIPIIEVNPEETELTRLAKTRIALPASQALAQLFPNLC